MSTYIMTDIHGHYDDMREMFGKIGYSAGDRLYGAMKNIKNSRELAR